MDDIVDRLRQDNCKLHAEAVAEIERLRTALRKIMNTDSDYWGLYDIAKDALKRS